MAVADTTVWQVAIYCENRGEMQAFGVSDGTNELFYTFFGRDCPQDTNWWTVYQGAFARNEWHAVPAAHRPGLADHLRLPAAISTS